jgi:hypothetical protein
VSAYVIIREDDGKYVSRRGSKHSYTKRLEDARLFPTESEAKKDACGNEFVVPLEKAHRFQL